MSAPAYAAVDLEAEEQRLPPQGSLAHCPASGRAARLAALAALAAAAALAAVAQVRASSAGAARAQVDPRPTIISAEGGALAPNASEAAQLASYAWGQPSYGYGQPAMGMGAPMGMGSRAACCAGVPGGVCCVDYPPVCCGMQSRCSMGRCVAAAYGAPMARPGGYGAPAMGGGMAQPGYGGGYQRPGMVSGLMGSLLRR
ncbi:unnamed protein product [Prorocentrum cordatum]|uniref:Uncharacterized protein n=1 Tax=Prorocentrum cordatum TaxID=2364126 RepID=A0ABN9TFF1_9DINO|nr:unnamed protein product [Polarella glacialis]